MNEGQKVLRQILEAGERLDRDAHALVQHARKEYQQARRYFASVDADALNVTAREERTDEP